MRRILLLLIIVLWCAPLHAQYTKLQGFCEDGNQGVVTSGLTSATKVQRSYPQCTVSVFDNGTANLSTIYSDSTGTPKANPFTSAADGQWFIYAAPGNHFDTTFSGGGLAAPFTRADWVAPLGSTNTISICPGTNFDTCLAAVSGTGGDIILGAATYIAATTETVPANVIVRPSALSRISVNAGITLTFVSIPDASDQPLFLGSGNLRLRGPIRLAWWLNGGNGYQATPYTSTDGTGGLLAAWNSLTNASGNYPDAATIYAPCGYISITVAPILYHETLYGVAANNQPYPTLKGCGIGNTVFATAAGIAGPSITRTGSAAYTGGGFEDVSFRCASRVATGINLVHATRSWMHRTEVNGCNIGVAVDAGYQIAITDGNIIQSNNVNIRVINLVNDLAIKNNELGNAIVAALDCRGSGTESNACGRNFEWSNNDVESSPVGAYFGGGHFIETKQFECEDMSIACVSIGKDSSGNAGETVKWYSSIFNGLTTGAGANIHIDDIGEYFVVGPSIPQLELSVGNTTDYSASPGATVTVSASSGGYVVLNSGHIATISSPAYSIPGGVTLPVALESDGIPRQTIQVDGRILFDRNCTNVPVCPTPASGVVLTIDDNASTAAVPSIAGLTPIVHLISKDATAETLLWDSFGTNNSISMRRADGTLVAPSAVQNGETLGHIGGAGYQSGGAYTAIRTALDFTATENWTNTNQGARATGYGTPNGSTTPALTFAYDGTGVFANALTIGNAPAANTANYLSLGTVAVGSLPAAGPTNAAQVVSVTNSTAIAAEGQVCAAGGAAVRATAISDGTVWKCF